MELVTEIIDALVQPKAYPHPIEKVQIIITAVSIVFLTGKYAYKINKPLNLGFLDFSTLEQRKEQCDKEVRYNSLISPQLYLGIVTINRDKNNNITVNGSGDIIEYGVKMIQMDPNATMDNLLRERKINHLHIKKLAQAIYSFHKIAPSSEHISSFGNLASIKYNWDENFQQTEKYQSKIVPPEDIKFIQNKINTFMKLNNNLFQDRVKKNGVRHCHGDFHSANVFIINNDISIFDASVINERFPCSDVIAEIAFMSMDLDHHNQRELSQLFVQEYQNLSQDADIPKLLDFYKCYRAYIRAKINCFALDDANLSSEKKQFHLEEAKNYFKLSKDYALLL